MKNTNDILTGIMVVVLVFWGVSVYDYIREKIQFKASGKATTASGARSPLQWLSDKLHLPRKKFARSSPRQDNGDNPPPDA